MCGHLNPAPRGRDFVTCNCGLRLSGPAPARRTSAASGWFAFLTVACILTAAVDLVRRLR
jgi:hypothetical protein